jgi:hypothetical protein
MYLEQHCSIGIQHLKSLYPEAEADRGNSRNVPFLCQNGQSTHRAQRNGTPQNAKFPASANGLDIASSILHSDEV